jgi:hypothetical protein
MSFREPKESVKMYPREYKYVTLEEADAKFLRGIILRYRRDGIRNGLLSLACLFAAYLMVVLVVNGDTDIERVGGALLFCLFVALGYFAAATPTAQLARDYLDARWARKRKIEIIDEDDLK